MTHDYVVRFKRLHVNAVIPEYKTEGSAGCDLYAVNQHIIQPGERELVPLGFSVEMPTSSMEMQIRPRSGLALSKGVTVLNAPGTIDSDYRGEIGVLLINLSFQQFVVQPGMRIAQAVFAPVLRAKFHEVMALAETKRGEGGFGSTGIQEAA